MGGMFQLKSEFSQAGDQPQAIERLVAGIEMKKKAQVLLGITGSGKTYTMAHVITRLGVPAIIMAPNKTLAAQLYSEMREFFPENAMEYFVSYYDYYQPEAYVPSKDLFIEKDSSINEHIEQMRLSATKALLEREDSVWYPSLRLFRQNADWQWTPVLARLGEALRRRSASMMRPASTRRTPS